MRKKHPTTTHDPVLQLLSQPSVAAGEDDVGASAASGDGPLRDAVRRVENAANGIVRWAGRNPTKTVLIATALLGASSVLIALTKPSVPRRRHRDVPVPLP